MTVESNQTKTPMEFIENQIRLWLEQNILSHISWVVRAAPLVDLRDVAVGYVIGVTLEKIEMYRVLYETDDRKLTPKDRNNIMVRFEKALPEIIENIEKEFCEW